MFSNNAVMEEKPHVINTSIYRFSW